jgi:hypothetical protein
MGKLLPPAIVPLLKLRQHAREQAMQNDIPMIEGRLNAHREILISLVTEALLAPGGANHMLRNLEQEVLLRDGSEDPGATPSAGLGRGNEKSQEIREILQTAQERAAALRRITVGNTDGTAT